MNGKDPTDTIHDNDSVYAKRSIFSSLFNLHMFLGLNQKLVFQQDLYSIQQRNYLGRLETAAVK